MQFTTEALTLRTYPFAEAHKVVVLLSRNAGLVRGVAYGARNSRSRFGSGLEPLTHTRATLSRRENQELAVVRNCEIIRPSPAYELDWQQTLHMSYFAELLLEFSREEMENERVFRLALAVTEAMGRTPVELLARYLELWLLRFEGVLPGLESLFPAGLAERTSEMLRQPPGQVREDSFSSSELAQLDRIFGRLIECHLEKPLKAKRILKELL